MSDEGRVTYRSVLANREFAAILVSQALSSCGDQIARIALAVLVYQQSHSALAASATYAISFGAYLVGGPFLATLADRYSRLSLMVSSDLLRALVVLLLAAGPDLGTAAVLGLILVLGLMAPAFDSARSATLPDILPGEAYVKGNALYNLMAQGVQVVGFLAGGGLLTQFSIPRVLLVDAATFVVSAGVLLMGLRHREIASAAGGRPHMLTDAAQGLTAVRAHEVLRRMLGYAVASAAAIAAPEALAVPVAGEYHRSTDTAGALTASIPAGFIVATFAILRVDPERRERLLTPLAALSAVPMLLTPLAPTAPVVVGLWFVSGLGSALQVIASAAYVQAAPPEIRARAYGLASTALMAGQGLAQLLAGAVASAAPGVHPSSWGVATLAAVSALLVLAVSHSSRSPGNATHRPFTITSQEKPETGR